LALPKTDIAQAELDRSRCAVLRREGVFPHPEQKIKRHYYQVGGGALAGGGGHVVSGGGGHVNCMDGQGDLRSWCGVSIAVGLKEVGKGQSQVVACCCSAGVGVSLQHEGLCHVTQSFFDGLGTNLPAFPKESSSSPGGKAQQ
jgi:hypothetical protein